ncbi:hypothetical protein EZV62_017116 [Acer yangbiense]|uniref:Bifunctional inhibitor/plant lipid transfer protein/seed storage helical domain-containing protein n=1 Tax=Acer yangbiense TaxID=1000413 RepID=A0A5C7HF94_9ROSI|nr:hypothetical protein EZV62_017116 [Acer yangbiense]
MPPIKFKVSLVDVKIRSEAGRVVKLHDPENTQFNSVLMKMMMKALPMLMIVLVMTSLVEKGRSHPCGSTYFSALVQLIPCRSSVAPFSPIPPSETCCNAVKSLGQNCLCEIVNGPPITGIDRNMALQLPDKCTANFEQCNSLSLSLYLSHTHTPPALPIIGHLHLLTPALYNSFFNLSSKYGPLLYLRLGAARCLLVSSASMASEVFKTHDLAFSSRPLFTFADKLLYGTSGFVTAPYGDYWRFMKKLCVTELLGVKQLERSRTIRREELRKLVAKVIKKATSKDQVLDVDGELMRLTNNVTCRMVMSTRCSGDDDDGEAERFWIYGKQALNLSKRSDELLEKVLKEHEERDGEREEDEDLMDILLKVYKDKKAEDLFIAGTDTTAEAMQWTIAELLNHPDAFKKVRQEIESVIGRTRLVKETDIPSLPYLQAVVKETLRLYPPAPVTTRECRQNCRIKGFDIPEKTAVSINLYAIMRDPDAWDNPEEFHPERFLIPSRDQEQKCSILFLSGQGGEDVQGQC